MGKSSHSAHSSNMASTMVTTVTAIFTFVIPPTVQLNSILDVILGDVVKIVGLTQMSKHQELAEFGEYVEKMVKLLVSALKDSHLTQHVNVVKNLEALQHTLHTTSSRISYLNGSGGMGSRFRHLLFPEEDHIPRMRQRLNDALSVFHFAATLELLAKCPNPPTGRNTPDPPKPDQSQIPYPSVPPAAGRPPMQRHQVLPTLEPTRDGHFHHQSHNARSCCQGTGPSGTSVVITGHPNPLHAEITVSSMNVDRLRRSLNHNHLPIRTMELAATLGHLSDLLEKAGRIQEALDASQESARLYRSLAG